MPLLKLKSKPKCDGSGQEPLRIIKEAVVDDNRENSSNIRGRKPGSFAIGICPVCGREEKITKSGLLGGHKTGEKIDVFYLQIDALTYGQINAIADLDNEDPGDYARAVLAEEIAKVMQGIPIASAISNYEENYDAENRRIEKKRI